jgi:GNAT superfamily N-acetyltransferase
MDETFTYRLMSPTDVVDVSELVTRVFNEFVAPECFPQGVQEFYRYSQPSEFLARQEAHHFALVSVVQDRVVGVIEIRFHKHVSLLFVVPEFQRRGIAKKLLSRALQICQLREPRLSKITVNSSPYAVPIYEKLGFCKIGDKQVKNGIVFIPMGLKLFIQQGDG